MPNKFDVDIEVLTQIASCCDTDTARYALDLVQAYPLDDGEVCLIATDGRCAGLVKARGRTKDTALIPKKVMPTSAAAIRRGYHVKRNGHWFGDNEKYTDVPDGEPHFPQVVEIVDLSLDDRIAVQVNPDLLVKLKKALNTESDSLTLFIRDPHSAINVLGDHGVGLCMPMSDDESAHETPDEASNRLKDKFKAMFDSVNPTKRITKRKPPKAIAETK